MRLLIGIATYKRTAKLKRCIDSILNSTYKDVIINVVADNRDAATFDFIVKEYPGKIANFYIQDSHQFVIGAWNKVTLKNLNVAWDGFIGLCDDVELSPVALENAVSLHKMLYPDGDGVVGFNQDCPGHSNYTFKWYGQTLMGRKFVGRYSKADYKICCPDYKHFCQDEEMWEYANSLKKFANCPGALLHHYHPSFIEKELDETHDVIRKGPASPQVKDFNVQARRRLNHYLWGRDFNLIGIN